MPEKCKLKFYEVTQCGFYARGGASPVFGSLEDLLAKYGAWAKADDTELRETCTFEAAENTPEAYCFDIEFLPNGDVVLVTWNKVDTVEGKMASVDGTDRIGNVHVKKTNVPDGHIPGYPTYFWFLPNQNLFATLRFDQIANGHPGLKQLLREYYAKYSPYLVATDEDADNVEIEGYREAAGKPVVPLVHFESRPKRKKGSKDFLKKNRSKITKMVSKETLVATDTADKDLFSRLLSKAGLDQPSSLLTDTHIRSTIDYNPTEAELDALLDDNSGEMSTKWEDVGFILRGESTPVWRSHTRAAHRTPDHAACRRRQRKSVDKARSQAQAVLLRLDVRPYAKGDAYELTPTMEEL